MPPTLHEDDSYFRIRHAHTFPQAYSRRQRPSMSQGDTRGRLSCPEYPCPHASRATTHSHQAHSLPPPIAVLTPSHGFSREKDRRFLLSIRPESQVDDDPYGVGCSAVFSFPRSYFFRMGCVFITYRSVNSTISYDIATSHDAPELQRNVKSAGALTRLHPLPRTTSFCRTFCAILGCQTKPANTRQFFHRKISENHPIFLPQRP